MCGLPNRSNFCEGPTRPFRPCSGSHFLVGARNVHASQTGAVSSAIISHRKYVYHFKVAAASSCYESHLERASAVSSTGLYEHKRAGLLTLESSSGPALPPNDLKWGFRIANCGLENFNNSQFAIRNPHFKSLGSGVVGTFVVHHSGATVRDLHPIPYSPLTVIRGTLSCFRAFAP
jgi:hypothetical protein